MNSLKVYLWEEEIGQVIYEARTRRSYFLFNPKQKQHPEIAPILRPGGKLPDSIPMPSDDRRIYQGLPPFLADSLPDSWGNRLFDTWVKENRIPANKITPLYKLMFIGKRGMGALEFEPAAKELEYAGDIDIKALYELSLSILSERQALVEELSDSMTMNSLMAVGTSAGGRQMKAVIAYNPETKEIRSGQISDLEGFKYFIIKFEDEFVPTSEIEMAYFEMARRAGITIQESELLNVEGINHFMTLRFDRNHGEKIFTQTLAAIDPEVDSYEALFGMLKKLNLPYAALSEMYRRTVFNVMANNTDDHNKNISFMLRREGEWELAPAYDLTFIFNVYGSDKQAERCMSLYGKSSGITRDDLICLAKENCIRNPEKIMEQVAEALKSFPYLAEKYRIADPWAGIIIKTLKDNLMAFGYMEDDRITEFIDEKGRKISNPSLRLNRRGIFEIRADVDEKPIRKFVSPGQSLYADLLRYQKGQLSEAKVLLSQLLS